MPAPGTDLSEFTQTKIALFLKESTLKKHIVLTLQHLGFHNVVDHPTPTNYFQAISRLTPIVAGEVELVLISLPEKPRTSGRRKDDVVPVYEAVNEVYTDLKSSLSKRTGDPLKHLSKTIPVIEVGDYLRDKLVEVLYRYRVPAAFFMSALESGAHLKGKRKADSARENFQTHFSELTTYLEQYFRDKDEMVALAQEKISEKELTQRKKEYDKYMAEAAELKEQGDFETAIIRLRQAIEVYPKDIEAYLESGRLYVRRREYGRALARFSQAEDIFVEAPSPNKEIANVRLTQAKERIEAGADPNSPEIKEMLSEAVENYRLAHSKSVDMVQKHGGEPDFEPPTAIGNEILKWDLTEFLGPKHPALKELHELAHETTEGLDLLPLDELTTNQCLALGLQALEKGDIDKSANYYFQALKDKERFTEVCTEINYLGIRLRTMGKVEEALEIYERLLRHNPHNRGSVYWNMAIAFAYKGEDLTAAGYAARTLYIDPFLPKEKEFYDSLTPQLAPTLIKLMKTVRHVLAQSRKVKPPPAIKTLYQAKEKLERLIAEGNKNEALQLFLKIFKQAKAFTLKPEFYGDGYTAQFLNSLRAGLAKSSKPQHQTALKVITAWVKHVKANPAPPKMALYLKMTRASLLAMAQKGDQPLAAFYLGQALMILPTPYWERPDFFARESLPDMVHEMAVKMKWVDLKRIPEDKLR